MAKKIFVVGIASIFLAGCGGPSADALVKQSIKCWDEAARVLEAVDGTASSLQEAQGKLQTIAQRMTALNKTATKQGLQPDELARIEADNDDASKKALTRFNEAARKTAAWPGGTSLVVRFNHQARGGL